MEIVTIVNGLAIKGTTIESSEIPDEFKAYLEGLGLKLEGAIVLKDISQVVDRKPIAECGVVFEGNLFAIPNGSGVFMLNAPR